MVNSQRNVGNAELTIVAQKIAAFKNTQKITKAMKMVAAAKLKRSQDRILAARPYAHQNARRAAAI